MKIVSPPTRCSVSGAYMSQKSATIRDVAQQAGVSVSTVSRILTGAETQIAISEGTRSKVLKAARDLAYRPHPGARSLRGKTTNLLGLIVREIGDPFFAQMIRVMSQEARGLGYEIVLGHAEADPEEVLRLSAMMLDMRYCDGLFLLGDLRETLEDHTFLEKIGWSTPLVMLCRGSGQLVKQWPSVNTDNAAGVSMGMEYLVSLGHRRIAFLNGGRLGDLNERQQAYHSFMQARFGESEPGLFQTDENSLEGGYQAMMNLIQADPMPSAVFASDDLMAMGAMNATFQCGICIPHALSIIGFDDIPVSGYTNPPLTTIRQPTGQIGRVAMKTMQALTHGNGQDQPAQHITIQPELVIRESSGPAKPENAA
jgi:DNA-binding LacI/PurR family transcriptional regulator